MGVRYGVRLDGTVGVERKEYLSLDGTWKEDLRYPMIFKREDEAAMEAFNLAAFDNSYFGRVSVIKLFPGFHTWFPA